MGTRAVGARRSDRRPDGGDIRRAVQEILGVQADTAAEGLQEELAQARALLEEKSRKERERKLADQKRGVILLLSFAALFAALVVRNPLAAACLVGLCFLAAAVVLYRNLPLLTAPQPAPASSGS